jgi:regulation of enolase protein 1 (concanavalin A-like superfamily)
MRSFTPKLFARLCLVFAFVTSGFILSAVQPDWWTDTNYSLVNEASAQDDALATVGQAKHAVQKAYQYLESELAATGGAGVEVTALFNSYCTTAPNDADDDLQLLTVGQLKYLSKPFYDHLNSAAVAFDTSVMTEPPTDIYPWTVDQADDDDLALATLGQLKFVFSFDLGGWPAPVVDVDEDGLNDDWEFFYFGSIQTRVNGSGDPNGDPDQDGVTNLNEFLDGTNPNLPPREGHSIWIREYAQQMLVNPSAVDEVINFCLEHNIQVIYLLTEELISTANYEQWEFVLGKIHAYGIEVEALLNNTDWLMPSGGWTATNDFPGKKDRSDGLSEVSKILDYQNAYFNLPKQSFDAIHFSIDDIDSLKSFNDPQDGQLVTNEDLIGWYLDFIEGVKSTRSSYAAPVSSIPYNWDLKTSEVGAVSINYESPVDGTVQEAWKHLIDQFEQVTLITYADKVRFFLANIQDEIDYIDNLTNPPDIRLYNEFRSEAQGNSLLDLGFSNEDYLTVANLRINLESIFGGKSYFKGWALHTYDNPNNIDGSFPSWLTTNTPFTYPQDMDFVPNGDRKLIPRSDGTVFDKPVYVRLNIKAHPDLEYVNSSDFSNMVSFIPVGPGYASEEDLVDLNTIVPTAYDGLAPSTWWYYQYIIWWEQQIFGSITSRLTGQGVCWENPATLTNPDLGVEREIVLNEGDEYRFIVAYNRASGISEEYFSIKLGATNPPGSTRGDSFDDPVEVDIYLDFDPDYGISNSPHLNQSFVIHDTDLDGTSDGQEAVFGLDPFSEDEGNIENPDDPTPFSNEGIAPWETSTIGGILPSKSSIEDDGKYTLLAAGDGLAANDSIGFFHQSISGDFTLSVRLHELAGNGLGSFGLMVRESLETDARYVTTYTEKVGGNYFLHRTESAQFGVLQRYTQRGPLPNHWIRLERRGDVITGYISQNGNSWISSGRRQLDLSDSVEVGFFLHSGNNEEYDRAILELIDFKVDQDQDGLWDDEELLYGTNPFNPDTDGDGVSDGEEVLERNSDPLVPEYTLTSTIESINGSAAISTIGAWQTDGDAIYSTGLNGEISFDFNVSEAGIYELHLKVGRRNEIPLTAGLPIFLVAKVDGNYISSVEINDGEFADDQVVLTPYLNTGQHSFQIRWDNVFKGRAIQFEYIKLEQPIFTNDSAKNAWEATILNSQEGVNSTDITAYISPARIEGRTNYLSLVQLPTGITAEGSNSNAWFTQIDLNSEQTTIPIAYQNGGKSENLKITWAPLSLFTVTPPESIYYLVEGDRLKLNLDGDATTSGSIEIDGVSYTGLSGNSDVIHDFVNTGSFAVNASRTDASGIEESMTITVVVMPEVQTIASPIAWIERTRNWQWTGLAAEALVTGGEAVVSVDPTSSGGQNLSFDVGTEFPEQFITARLPSGEAVASSMVRPVWVIEGVEGYLREYDLGDGTSVVKSTVHISPGFPDDAIIRLEIFKTGVTFEDGTRIRELTNVDFTEYGTYKYTMIKLDSVIGSACHNVKIYQNGNLVGQR